MSEGKKIRNPVSRHIALNSVWNAFGDYLPKIFKFSGSGYGIDARLPREIHKKWIGYIAGIERFRDTVKEEIEDIFSSYAFNGQSFLEIQWRPRGVSFETDGVNGCIVYVEDGPDYGYTVHNVDNYEQASVLFIAFSVYLPKLYSALETFESGNIDLKKVAPLKEGVTQRIKLNRVKECDMKSDECLHWKTYLCEYCSRNPKAFFLTDKKNIHQIGDKWEPEGGLPGKNFCRVCHANISKPVCPHCGMDNSDDFN
jgi:hypothetical protein